MLSDRGRITPAQIRKRKAKPLNSLKMAKPQAKSRKKSRGSTISRTKSNIKLMGDVSYLLAEGCPRLHVQHIAFFH
jgi:hypothetical protein